MSNDELVIRTPVPVWMLVPNDARDYLYRASAYGVDNIPDVVPSHRPIVGLLAGSRPRALRSHSPMVRVDSACHHTNGIDRWAGDGGMDGCMPWEIGSLFCLPWRFFSPHHLMRHIHSISTIIIRLTSPSGPLALFLIL